MKVATSSEFRNNAKRFLDEVERGQTYEIYRHGRPVAVLTPTRRPADSKAYWRTVRPLRIPGLSLSRAIIAERRSRKF
ncbi:MAG: type II toxin-antitoxin system Phd/YefM family antitoxin [Candidatus Coatesbacteria bacterium]